MRPPNSTLARLITRRGPSKNNRETIVRGNNTAENPRFPIEPGLRIKFTLQVETLTHQVTKRIDDDCVGGVNISK